MFINELFEGRKAPEMDVRMLVGEVSAHAKEVAKKRAEYERQQDKKRDDRGETYNVGNAKATKPAKVSEATGLKKHVRIVAGPAKGKTGYVGEVRHGMFKGAPKTYTIDLDGGGNIRCSKEQLRLIKEPVSEFADATQIQIGTAVNHGLAGNAKVIRISGPVAEIVSARDGKHYKVQLSSLRLGDMQENASINSTIDEDSNPQDAVTVDIPLLIRLLEYAREDAKTDMDLHNVAEQLIKLSANGDTLSMEQYDQIVGGMQEMAPGRSAYAGRGNVPGMASA